MPLLPVQEAADILDALPTGSTGADEIDRLFDLAVSNPHDYSLFIDQLPRMSPTQVRMGVRRDPTRAGEVARAMQAHLVGDWDRRSFRWADSVILFLFRICEEAASMEDLGLLDEAAAALFSWDASWNQWPPQGPISQWLTQLRGDVAGVVAGNLRAEPDSAEHFSEVADNPSADVVLRQAINARTATG